MLPEKHTKRQATHHGCLPSLLGDGDKGIEMVYGEEKNILYRADLSSPGRTKSLVPARQAQRTNQERAPSFVPIHLSFNSEQGPPLSSISGGASCHSLVKIISGFPLVQFRELEASRVQGRTFQSDNWNDFLHQKMFARGWFGGPKVQGPQPERWFCYRRVVKPDFVKEIWVRPMSSSATSTSC